MSKLDYSPLWATMKEKGISQYRLLKCGVDNKTLDTLKKGRQYYIADLRKDMLHSRLHAQ